MRQLWTGERCWPSIDQPLRLAVYLDLTLEQVGSLGARREIPRLLIKGEERSDIHDVERLVTIYRNTAIRMNK